MYYIVMTIHGEMILMGTTPQSDALVQTRINKEIKEEAAAVLGEIGLTISDAIRLLLTKVAKERELPFEPFIPGPITIAAMQACLDAKPGDNPRFSTVAELLADLHAPD